MYLIWTAETAGKGRKRAGMTKWQKPDDVFPCTWEKPDIYY